VMYQHEGAAAPFVCLHYRASHREMDATNCCDLMRSSAAARRGRTFKSITPGHLHVRHRF